MCSLIFNFRLFLSSLLVAVIANNGVNSKAWPVNEICNNYNGRRIYLEINEFGTLIASNVSLPENTNVINGANK